jgi:hypothetical protein
VRQSLDVTHITPDEGGTSIEGYEWRIIHEPDDNPDIVKEANGDSRTTIFHQVEKTGEYQYTAADTAEVNGYNIASQDGLF